MTLPFEYTTLVKKRLPWPWHLSLMLKRNMASCKIFYSSQLMLMRSTKWNKQIEQYLIIKEGISVCSSDFTLGGYITKGLRRWSVKFVAIWPDASIITMNLVFWSEKQNSRLNFHYRRSFIFLIFHEVFLTELQNLWTWMSYLLNACDN